MWWLRPMRRLRGTGTRLYAGMHDPLDHVTGIEKRELLAHLAGDCDPFRIMSIKKGLRELPFYRPHARDYLRKPVCIGMLSGPGTWERPNLIPSSNDKRLVACSCSPCDNHLEFMWLHMGCPKRCGCGYWFVLCPVAPL